MSVIRTIGCRRILNSHVRFTHEFTVELEGGKIGSAASPEGETLSIYEDEVTASTIEQLTNSIMTDGVAGKEIDQAGFDAYLRSQFNTFGRNNCCALSTAFFEAERFQTSDTHRIPLADWAIPRLCLNILNGGQHAYTNPVLSDFPEFLLIARNHELETLIQSHEAIQRLVKEKLQSFPLVVVNNNPVRCFKTRDNRECLDFLLSVLDHLGLQDQFNLMIDASASHFWDGTGYRFYVTDGRVLTSEAMIQYWVKLAEDYRIKFLEDPLREQDLDAWRRLCREADVHRCAVIGDNLYATDAARIEQGAGKGCTQGVIIKPNQAGTVTGARAAVEAARRHNQIIITSHRSISTEEKFLAYLSCSCMADFCKIGPLITDYSSVLRLNEMIRLTGESSCHRPPSSAPSGTRTRNTTPSGAMPVRSTSL